jgi:hypothetical protein
MATFVKTDAGTWKAVIRKQGWPITSKTFRTKRDATDWARSTEDEMVRGVYISRAGAERMTVEEALKRYLQEVTPTKKPTTQRSEKITAEHLMGFLGKYSMAALSSDPNFNRIGRCREESLLRNAVPDGRCLCLRRWTHCRTGFARLVISHQSFLKGLAIILSRSS